MSTDTEHVEDEIETSVLESWTDWYHVPILGVVMLFMVWVRTQAYENVAMSDGQPALSGIDSWYHWRTVQWTAENYPWTMPYEIWTGFPTGRYVGQFGTLFDQLIVTVAMIVGLGDPSTETLYTVALVMVPIIAALVAVPVFYMGRRLGGTFAGLISVLVLALFPGRYLYQTTVGQLQHHGAEVLFMAIAVLAMMVALRVGEREKPIYELVLEQDWNALREPTIYSVLAGIALTLYLMVWPPAIVLIGIFAIFFTVQLCLDYVRGTSPDHIAFVGVVGLGTTAILTGLLVEEPGISVTSFSYLQPLTAALVAIGCAFMAWLARQWNRQGIDRRYYPAAVAGLIAAAFLVMWLALPDLFGTIVDNAMRRVFPFGGSATDATIAEAQPPENFTQHVFDEFGAAFYTMVVGLGLLIARGFLDREYRTEYTLVIVWSLFLTSMAATQIRFAYYLALPVAVVNAVFLADIARLFDLNLDVRGGVQSIREIETYQFIVVFMVVLLLFAPLLPPIATATAWERGSAADTQSDAVLWEDSNEWLEENTPEPGNWGGADNASELDLYGTYDYPEGEDYDYPDGAYGVMSWWDYGHLITTQGERIPHANPFQQNAGSAAAYLTAESEQRAELILDAIAAGESPVGASNEELEQMAASTDDPEELRYVMIDDQMVGDKFPAIATWSGPSYDYYTTPADLEGEEPLDSSDLSDLTAPYDDTLLSQLYFDDADGMEHYRLVHENDAQMSIFASYAQVFNESAYEQNAPEQAQQFTNLGYENGDVLYLDEDGNLAAPGEGEPAITVNRQVDQQEWLQVQQSPNYEVFDVATGPGVKTFERVDGATLTGEVDVDDVSTENATAVASVELETPEDATNRTVTYTQTADLADDGSFELTVPYATNDELGVEDGYTNSSVEATGEYAVEITAPGDQGLPVPQYQGQTAVPETDVVDGNTVTVDLEEADIGGENETAEADANDSDAGNESDSETDDSNADANETSDTDEETTADEAATSIAPLAVEPA